MAPIPVGQICEELWGCQDMWQAAPWLQLFNHSILRAKLETYDVSECFLAIQGAAIRFAAQVNGRRGARPESTDDDDDDEILTKIWEESMWAAAALARLCVGPAWVHQLQQRRAFLSSEHNHHGHGDDTTWTTGTSSLQNDAPVDIVSTNNSSPRSFSPMTFASAVDSDVYFPPIPEALPGVMLRFGASALDALPKQLTTRSLAEAQREMVLALCCRSTDIEEPERVVWTIPGAHAPVQAMMRFWLESIAMRPMEEHDVQATVIIPMGRMNISDRDRSGGAVDSDVIREGVEMVDLQPIGLKAVDEVMKNVDYREQEDEIYMMNQLRGQFLDWWYCLQVARASMDLLSAGWKPQHGYEVVLHLLAIAENGVALKGLTCDATDIGKKAREERLAATASAAEAISALSLMGSRGIFPANTQSQVIRVLVDLQVIASMPKTLVTSMYPTGVATSPEAEDERQLEQNTFLTQRNACFADSADLLWVLLAEPESTAITAYTLMRMLNIKVKATVNVVVRVLSGAFWGNPPSVPSIEHLRLYWGELLGVLAKKLEIASTDIQQQKLPDDDGKVETFTVALEMVAALGRFVDATLLRGNGSLSPIEWECFIYTLDVAIKLCLPLNDSVPTTGDGTDDISTQRAKRRSTKVHQEVTNILLKVGDFLDRAATFEAGICHLIVDSKCRNDLHILLLREAVPRMNSQGATKIGCCVIRSWASGDFLPHGSEQWIMSASSIVKEAFAIIENDTPGLHVTYTHSPLVRLESLKAVAGEQWYEGIWPEFTIEDRNIGSSNSPSFMAPLRATRNLCEIHRELVCDVLIPCLNSIFGFNDDVTLRPVDHSIQEARLNIMVDTDCDQPSRLDVEEFELRKFSVHLIGFLFRDDAVDGEHRSLCINMLHEIASPSNEDMEVDIFGDVTGTSTSETKLFSRPVVIAIYAIRELELCLQATFNRLPHSYDSTVSIIEILCALLLRNSVDMQRSCTGKVVHTQMAHVLLALGCLIPLARLRSTINQRITLVEREDVLWHVPDSLKPFLVEDGKLKMDHTLSQRHRLRAKSKWIRKIFALITSSIMTSLKSYAGVVAVSEEITASQRFLNDVHERHIATCLDAIRDILLSGTTFQDPLGIASALSILPETNRAYRKIVNTSKCKASTIVVQAAITVLYEGVVQLEPTTHPDEVTRASAMKSISALFNMVVTTCIANDIEISIIGCQNLRALLVATSISHDLLFRTPCAVTAMLCRRLEFALTDPSNPSDETSQYWIHRRDVVFALLSVLNDVLSQANAHYPGLGSKETFDIARTVLTVCFQIAQLTDQSKASGIVAMQCSLNALKLAFASSIETPTTFNDLGEVIAMMNETLAFKNTFTHATDLMQPLLSQQHQELQHSRGDFRQFDAVEMHESIARDTEDIKRFVVEGNRASEICASWLCGGCLLTIRRGAKGTRYFGWTEITLRGLSFRRRHLVRHSNSVSIDTPELPSTLWEDQCGPLVSPINHSQQALTTELPHFYGQSDVVSQALQLLSRADAELNNHVENHDTDNLGGSLTFPPNSPGRYISDTQSPSTSHSVLYIIRNTEERTYLSLASESVRIDETYHSIHDWLCKVYSPASEDAIKCIDDYLESTGFSCSTIASDVAMASQENVRPAMLPMMRLNMDSKCKRAISILDRTTTINTHKIALLYVGQLNTNANDEIDQASFEASLFGTTAASSAFTDFCYELGHLVKTSHLKYFSGGFDTSGLDNDGTHALLWIDIDSIVLFHTVLFMPEGLNARKRHVGNDNVHIFFVEPSDSLFQELLGNTPGIETSFTLVSGQFGFLTIFVLPFMHHIYRIIVQMKPGLDENMKSQLMYFCGNYLVPNAHAATKHVRETAVYADFVCRSVMENLLGPPTVWEDRCCQLKNMERYKM